MRVKMRMLPNVFLKRESSTMARVMIPSNFPFLCFKDLFVDCYPMFVVATYS